MHGQCAIGRPLGMANISTELHQCLLNKQSCLFFLRNYGNCEAFQKKQYSSNITGQKLKLFVPSLSVFPQFKCELMTTKSSLNGGE